jgi:aminoglycoside 3-N-acetyltransferase
MNTKSNFINNIQQTIDDCGMGPLIVHSDVMYAMKAVKLASNVTDLLNAHIDALEYCASSRSLLFPTFNYQFPRTKLYCLKSTESEVGKLGEFARTHWADWRTDVPMYNFCGKGQKINLLHDKIINPFGENSVFAEVTNNDGVVLMYGTSVARSTIIHYIEHMIEGGPLYRYDKEFHGVVKDENGVKKSITLINHVRPLVKHLAYDWDKIEQDLLADNILIPIKDGASFAFVYSAKKILDYVIRRIESDPFYLIDDESKVWAVPMIEKLERRLHLSDFES